MTPYSHFWPSATVSKIHGFTQSLFRLGRHLMQPVNYRLLRAQAFQVWRETACA
ncbi:MAG: hypothetical protein R3B95_01660 [Nitrospirales bacterium]|nr:hypothetical protein [Nitrospirales bacterium]